jgi:glycosyltransferase involved in cell wall biosynthesis
VCLVTRDEPGTTGTSRYVEHLSRGLVEAGLDVVQLPTRPTGRARRALSLGHRIGLDLNSFLAAYPVRLTWPEADVYHLTVQTYASVLVTNPPPGPVVVTVHDLIPYLVRHDPRLNAYRHPPHRLFDRLAMRGLERASHLLADSRWTKGTLVDELGVPPGRITVVPLGVDVDRYRPRGVPAAFRERYQLPEAFRYVLYVGSEDPRKNLEELWRAFALVHRAWPDARLLKVGPVHNPREREKLARLAEELGISPAVHFFGHVPEGDLPFFYNAAATCVLPSLYEGFGLPLLEALACGTRVICSDRGSLPELADAGALVVPPAAEAIAAALQGMLSRDGGRREDNRLPCAPASFSWANSVAQLVQVYGRAARSPSGLRRRTRE